ncbi:beta-ketoacyl synthase N-terminal-like domain-containing protein [Kitasatospora sp. NPDC096147]|uniref:beta-ketoacyl synthase N-terminal-like domain-containing protein n=1 Tax=Kitasatospora sp. NPDC096147 TaxID=3364093 RepID=UPI0037F49DAC
MSKYAIVGLSCLFPGAATPAEFWQNLSAGVDSRREGGAEVFGPAADPRDEDPAHRIYCSRGGFVSGFDFDPTGYLLDADRLAGLDRVFHWTLHVAREALRDSGAADRPEVLARTGLIMGNYSFPTPGSARISLPLVDRAVLAGLREAGLPGLTLPEPAAAEPADARVSGAPARVAGTALGLGGPRFALDAACSSALYALKLACDQLAAGQADLVLAGGVCAPDPTLIHLSFSDLHAYPENGFSQPFDAASAGILTGQGAGMVAVKRLADAQRDGDRIHAVIDGIGLTNDGAGRHLLLPNAAGQHSSYRHAYAEAGVEPTAIDYLECHATGTPAGDSTEAESVARWFGGHGRVPLLGSVKGNIGHLLTVAGLSSLLKVILAMQHGELPPTIGVQAPVDATIGAALVRERTAWPEHEGPRRAAVSAFGFGGTNAHVVLSGSADQEAPAEAVEAPALDIVGLGAHFGTLETVTAFERALHEGTDAFRPLPELRWRGMESGSVPEGGFVDQVAIDPVDYRIPPADLRNYNLQHALMAKVADEALADAGFARTPAEGQSVPAPRRVAVVVAMEIEPSAHLHLARHGLAGRLREAYAAAGLELTDRQAEQLAEAARDGVHQPIVANEVLSYIGNIMASRISALWNLTGPSFTISSDGAGTAEALDIARLLLLDPEIEAVLVGAVDLAGSPESLLLRGDAPVAGAGLSFGAGSEGWRIGEGAGAVVVTRPGSDRPVYARLDSAVVRHAVPVAGALPEADPALFAETAREALALAGVGPAEIGYLEAHAGGTPEQDTAELTALAAVYPAGACEPALGSGKAQLGDTQGAATMAGLLRAVLALHHGYLPAVPNWRGPAERHAETFAAAGFHLPGESRPWLRAERSARRYAAVSFLGAGGAHGHLVLSAGQTRGASVERDWRRAGGPVLLALGATDEAGLLAELDRHLDLLSADADPYALAVAASGRLTPELTVRAVLVGADADALAGQLTAARRDLPGVFERGEEWATPAGSYATARPIGPDGKVALVYPGAFNSYPGLGRDLFRAFPGLLTRFEAEAEQPDRAFRSALLHPRSQQPLGKRELMGLEEQLGGDLPFMLATGTSFAILYTDLVRELLGVEAHGAFGYSLGESSMLFATGGWQREARRDDRISATPLFKDRLCGPRRTVRELWQLPEDAPDSAVWGSHVLLAGADAVRAAMASYDRVYLTHVNTPNEVVIAGAPDQCKALIAELGCPSARSPVNSVMHCPVVDGELGGLAELNDHPVGPVGGLSLFTAYDYATVGDLDRRTVAERIAHTLRSTIDFPKLTRTAYDQGFRYFVEVGPSSTCTRWVKESLGADPHVAVSVDRRGVPATRSIAQLAARLLAHGVPLDLTALLGELPAPAGRRLRFPVGGGPSIPAAVAAAAAPVLSGVTAQPAAFAGVGIVAGAPLAAAARAGVGAGAGTSTARPAVSARSRLAEAATATAPGGTATPVTSVARAASATSVAPVLSPVPTVETGQAGPAGPARSTGLAGAAGGAAASAQPSAPVAILPGPPAVSAAAPSAQPTSPERSSAAVPPSSGPSGPVPVKGQPPMPVDPSVADPEVITFDGEPISFLPWAEPEAAQQSAAVAVPAHSSAPAPATVPQTGDNPAGQLVRELREQLLATHSVVMETQRVLQESTLSRAEALLAQAPVTRPELPVLPAPEPIALVIETTVPQPPALPAAASVVGPEPLAPAKPAGVIWDQADLLEFATGSLAKVFGAEFAEIDSYGKRVRLPAEPYHFVTRVTDLKAETGVYQPSFIRTEYDVPEDAWYAVDGGVPPAVAIEAGQCDLLLISYLGIDFKNKGKRVYRLLDSTLVFHGDLPKTGQTLRYDISINRFVTQGETTIFFFSYLCYADGELILELKDACAGFFSQQELETPLGVVITEKQKAERAALKKTWFKPLADTGHNDLTAADLELLAQGKPGEVFGPHHAQDEGMNPALRLPDARLRMIDQLHIDRTGGPRGLGLLTASKRLQPDAWYFECHFPDDPVLAGSMVAEGAVQALQAYLLHQGMHLVLPDARFQTIIGLQTEVQVRGQITPQHSEIRYEIEVMELTLLPRPSVIADILVYLGDKPVIRMHNFGIQIREKDGAPYRPEAGGVPVFLGRRNRSGEPAMINELHLAHAAKGDLGTAMGPEFDVYANSRAPYIPNGDFQFVDRIMRLDGTRGDLNPGSEMVTEYDSPADAWYYTQNAHPHMPNAVYMETSLQAAILLGYYLGATLKRPEEQYAIRNLDGKATLVKDLDLRGKTVRHHSKLLMTSAMSGAVLQNFSYELSADGEVFYVGESLFGYFSDAALANQVGLDAGQYVAPWIEQAKPANVRRIELPADAPAFTDPTGGRLHLPGEHFALVDRVDLVEGGGKHGAGYLHGHREVRPDEWYFDCHFHRDPVMPGSLGVEAILQGLRLFALEQGLAEGIENPRFGLAVDVPMSWKYRGQILRHDKELSFDVHVKEIRREPGRVVVVADAELWKPGLRIYELTDVAIEVRSDAV